MTGGQSHFFFGLSLASHCTTGLDWTLEPTQRRKQHSGKDLERWRQQNIAHAPTDYAIRYPEEIILHAFLNYLHNVAFSGGMEIAQLDATDGSIEAAAVSLTIQAWFFNASRHAASLP